MREVLGKLCLGADGSLLKRSEPCDRPSSMIKPLSACKHHKLHSHCRSNKGCLKPTFKTEDLSVYWKTICQTGMAEMLHISTFLARIINIKGFQIPLLCRCGSMQKQGMKPFTRVIPFIHLLYWEKGRVCTAGHSLYGFFGFPRKNRDFFTAKAT